MNAQACTLERPAPADSAIVFIDHQPQMLFGVGNVELLSFARS